MTYFKTQLQFYSRNVLAFIICFTLLLHFVILISKIKPSIDFSLDENVEEKIVIKLNTQTQNKRDSKQIVETQRSNLERKTEDSKFFSEQNNFVDRQTVARDIGKFQEAASGSKFGDEKSIDASQSKKQEKVSLSDLGIQREKLIENLVDQVQIARPKKGLENGKGEKAGLSKRSDFIEELPLGDFTKLNTVEYKYYGFFFRIKQKLEQFWGESIQNVAQNLFKEGRRLPANKHYITSLVISMDEAGRILKVDVDSTSGVRELDGAAISSFNKAGPFPNPPKGLINNGVAQIRWKFAVDANK